MSFYAHPDGRFYRFASKKDAPKGFVEVGEKRADVEMYYRNLQDAGGEAEDVPSLNSLTVAELDALAAERGVEFTDGMLKADKVAALEKAG